MRSRREAGWLLRGIGEVVDDVVMIRDSIPVCSLVLNRSSLSTHLISKTRVNTLGAYVDVRLATLRVFILM